MEKYRFNNSDESVYLRENDADFFIGSYYAYGITKRMSYKKAAKIVEKVWYNEEELTEEKLLDICEI